MKARLYDAVVRALDARGFAARRRTLVAGLQGEVVEVGAGTGRNLALYATATRLTLVEPDPRYRAVLADRARVDRPGAATTILAGHAEALPLADSAVDHVVFSLALCSVARPAAALAEAARVLRPGGRLHALEHVVARPGTRPRARLQRALTPLQRRIADGCHLDRDPAAALRAAGWEIEREEHFLFPRGAVVIHDGLHLVARRPA